MMYVHPEGIRLHKRLLPTPSRWYQAARALHTVLRIQSEPRTSLLRIAHELGYADHSALSQLVYRSFRVRPGTIRGTLGWEWLMHRWLQDFAYRIEISAWVFVAAGILAIGIALLTVSYQAIRAALTGARVASGFSLEVCDPGL